MPDKIPSNSTVATVWPLLAHQRMYVAGVRHKMLNCFNKYGNAFVRIGITGSGQKPCYRIFHESAGVATIFGSYWDNHQPLEKEDSMSTNWSESFMSFAEIDAFLKEKTNWKRKFH